ncbi:MAG: cell division protein FtsA [Dehalococcoidia bacterium]
MGKEPRTIIAIDAGSCNVKVLAARMAGGADFDILALGHAPSLGVKRGIVSNIDETSYAIREALEDAGVDGHGRAVEVYAGISGKHLASLNNVGEAKVARNDGLVVEKDVVRAMSAARDVELGDDAYVVHHVPRAFRIDGYHCRRNPVGMHGATARAEAHLVTASAAAVKNLKKAVQMAGVDIDGIVVNGIAASHVVLRRDEREMGVVLLDIGGGTTDIVAYNEGAIYHTSALPLGGNQLSNDVAKLLNTAPHFGERLLLEHGTGSTEGIDLHEELTVPCFGTSGYRRFRLQYLCEIIRLRLTEILQLALAQVRRESPTMPATAGLVLTGGVAGLPGIERLAERAVGLPARVGTLPPQQYAPQTLKDPSYAALIGTLYVASDPWFAPVSQEKNGHQNGFRFLPQIPVLRS